MDVGAPEFLLCIIVTVLLFGAKKLPELARGSGRALRIFKAETKGLADDGDENSSGQQTQEEHSSTRAGDPTMRPAEAAPGGDLLP
jgi:sec-independent protein translocase protein TatA